MRRKFKVGIIGCGKILPRHLESIEANSDRFELVALCDLDKKVLRDVTKEHNVPGFTDYKEMLKDMKMKMNFVVIATPNSLHYPMAIDSLEAGYDILVEKPIDFDARLIHQIGIKAEKEKLNAYAVLQVRYNPSVTLLQQAIEEELLGDLRIISFVQRWQRPYSYFEGWRGKNGIGGGTLYECAIHYLDILQLLFGVPNIQATSVYSHKHKHIDIEDTILSIAEYPNGSSGTIEVTIASEPSNIECSLSLLCSKSFVEIGGWGLDKVEKALFENPSDEKRWKTLEKKYGQGISPNTYGTHVGSCPNHPTLYKEIAKGNGISILEAAHSIEFIQRIYTTDDVEYSSE